MLEGWFFITAALLALSGGAKIRDPEPTRGALTASGLPSGRGLVTLLGVLEVVAGISALVGLRAGALTVALLYGAFAVFIGYALRRRLPIQSCGCFGKVDTPPSIAHLVVNITAAVAALGVVAFRPTSLPDVVTQQPAWGLPYLFMLGLGVFLLGLILTRLPAITARRLAT